jgi:hypothetical protein
VGVRESRRVAFSGRGKLTLLLAAVAFGGLVPGAARAGDTFPVVTPVVHLATADGAATAGIVRCETLRPDSLLRAPLGSDAAVRRALALLERRITLADEEMLRAPDGTVIRFTSRSGAFDRLDPTDADADGRADLLQATLAGLDEARQLLAGRLELPAPAGLEVLLAELGNGAECILVPGADGSVPTKLLLDASPRGGADGLRRAAAHEYAHAVALEASRRFPEPWAEALATWTTLVLDGGPDAATAELFSRRIRRLADGLNVDDPVLAAGNALWLAFLDEAYGPVAVRLTIQELAAGGSVSVALDRALRRASRDDLTTAFREFHLWALLVGERADGHHLSFAAALEAPEFSSSTEGLPALSVLADPAVAPLGASQVLLRPQVAEGGMRLHFEGEFTADWDADLVLFREDGSKFRLPLKLVEGRGDTTIPLEGVASAWLLIRNLGGEASGERRYSYAAHREPGYPFELDLFEAAPAGADASGVLVSWETASEQRLLGFNVLRSREDGGPVVAVNPLWVPALGDAQTPTAYRYLDRSAEPGVAYLYRIQGITIDGLTSETDTVAVQPVSSE